MSQICELAGKFCSNRFQTHLHSFLFDMLLKLLFTMLDKVIFHAGHELPHVSHDNLRVRFLRVQRASDEVVDILSESRGLV